MRMIGHLAKALIRVYQLFITPVTGGHCRYAPTCSQYAIEAIHIHGPLTGGWLAVRRIVRCHPWGDCGHDPVPGARVGGDGIA